MTSQPVLIGLKPGHLCLHVGQHLLINLQAALQLDPFLHGVDDLYETLAVLQEAVCYRLVLGQLRPLEAGPPQLLQFLLDEEGGDPAVTQSLTQ